MHDIGFARLVIEAPRRILGKFTNLTCRESALLAKCQLPTKLASQVRIEHIQGACNRRGRGETPDSEHRPAHKTPTRQALFRYFGSLGPATMQHLVLLRRDSGSIAVIAFSNHKILNLLLQVKVNVRPGPFPAPTGTAEEATSQCNESPESQKHRKRHNRHLAVRVSATRVAINVRQNCQRSHRQTRNHHTPAVRLDY